MIYVALVGLPVLLLVNTLVVVVLGSDSTTYGPGQDLPGKRALWLAPAAVSLFILGSSFTIHLMEVL